MLQDEVVTSERAAGDDQDRAAYNSAFWRFVGIGSARSVIEVFDFISLILRSRPEVRRLCEMQQLCAGFASPREVVEVKCVFRSEITTNIAFAAQPACLSRSTVQVTAS